MKAGASRFHEHIRLGGLSPVDFKVSTSDTDGALTIGEYTGFDKGGPPLHIHPDQDEVFIVIEGEHLFQVGDLRHRLTAGDTIFIPRNVPHAPAQVSDKSKYLFFFTPASQMEDFFRALGKVKSIGQPSLDQMAGLFVSHGMKIVGPPLTW
ncbi:cupin domain-containing protein [Hymenobacter sp. PAMC 26628]|uniref:cupin domain-containing protein n=1 Tax=Hymenobacter sp. PAMC 26628 TaxID=1484118 RepID=UPI00194E64B3|nr:cupin domain-containing protein [Hymenobacter sp. PAMC 26628]